MVKRQTTIKIIAFILVFFTMLITLPIKRYYNDNISITRDEVKHKTMIIVYKDKKLLKTAILKLIDKNILTLTEYQYYRLNRFLFGYRRPILDVIGTVSNIDR